jgi:hypothetical protein
MPGYSGPRSGRLRMGEGSGLRGPRLFEKPVFYVCMDSRYHGIAAEFGDTCRSSRECTWVYRLCLIRFRDNGNPFYNHARGLQERLSIKILLEVSRPTVRDLNYLRF